VSLRKIVFSSSCAAHRITDSIIGFCASARLAPCSGLLPLSTLGGPAQTKPSDLESVSAVAPRPDSGRGDANGFSLPEHLVPDGTAREPGALGRQNHPYIPMRNPTQRSIPQSVLIFWRSCATVKCIRSFILLSLSLFGCTSGKPPVWVAATNCRVAFVSTRSGVPQLFLLDPTAATMEQVTDLSLSKYKLAHIDTAWGIAHVALTVEIGLSSRDILNVCVEDGTATNLTDRRCSYSSNPRLSPDGRTIVFQSITENNLDIYCVAADGAHLVRLTTDPGHDMCPEWSPDGRHIVFISQRSGGNHLYSMESDGGEQHQVTPTELTAEHACWSPTGDRVVFSANGSIYVIRLDGSDLTQLTKGATVDEHPGWAPGGDRIAFVSKKSAPTVGSLDENWVSVMKSDGTDVRCIARSQDIGHISVSRPLRWSREGNLLVVTTCRCMVLWGRRHDPEIDFEVYVIDSRGAGSWNISRHSGYDGEPAWYLSDR